MRPQHRGPGRGRWRGGAGDGREHLEGAIESVLQQDYDNVELIVIDGGSTDGTLQVVQDQEDCIDYYVSEKDIGIADAWNKGLACASGDIIGFLNADDYYSVNTNGSSPIVTWEQTQPHYWRFEQHYKLIRFL